MYLYKNIIEKEKMKILKNWVNLRIYTGFPEGFFSKFSKNRGTTLACLKFVEVGFSTDLIFSSKRIK